jgi:hypothetical protein
VENPQYLIHAVSGRRNFEVQDAEGRSWASLRYTGWLWTQAEGQADGHALEIVPKSIWQTRFDILLDGADVGDIIFNWKTQMIIRLNDFQGMERHYLLRRKGFFNQRFVLEDDIKNPILYLKPKLRWKILHYDYPVFMQETQYLQSNTQIMLAVCGFAMNLYMKRKANTAAGGA